MILCRTADCIARNGRYHDMGSFASDISNLSRIVTLNNLAITTAKEGALTMNVTAKTFRYLDTNEINAQRKAASQASRASHHDVFKTTVLLCLAGFLTACGSSSRDELSQWMPSKRRRRTPDQACLASKAIQARKLHACQ